MDINLGPSRYLEEDKTVDEEKTHGGWGRAGQTPEQRRGTCSRPLPSCGGNEFSRTQTRRNMSCRKQRGRENIWVPKEKADPGPGRAAKGVTVQLRLLAFCPELDPQSNETWPRLIRLLIGSAQQPSPHPLTLGRARGGSRVEGLSKLGPSSLRRPSPWGRPRGRARSGLSAPPARRAFSAV